MPVGIWDHVGMLTHDVPAQSRDWDSDQRSKHEEHRETGTLDDEARGSGKQAPRKGAERGQKGELARSKFRCGE